MYFLRHGKVKRKHQCLNFCENFFEDNDEERHWDNNITVSGFGKIKKMVFGYADKTLPNHLNGIHIQRAQMPITQGNELIEVVERFTRKVPNSHIDKFYGFIILDYELEGKIVKVSRYTLWCRKTSSRDNI